jgi:AbrB family looped-hinge helix DNA binding protein
MPKKDKVDSCCGPDGKPMGFCNVEAIVTIDDRGQILLPKELREKAKINSGDKLAVVTCENDGEVSVIALIKSDNIAGMIKDFLGPAMGDIFSK